MPLSYKEYTEKISKALKENVDWDRGGCIILLQFDPATMNELGSGKTLPPFQTITNLQSDYHVLNALKAYIASKEFVMKSTPLVGGG